VKSFRRLVTPTISRQVDVITISAPGMRRTAASNARRSGLSNRYLGACSRRRTPSKSRKIRTLSGIVREYFPPDLIADFEETR
jgi:hypothetical protein